jgi:hypothetical protein
MLGLAGVERLETYVKPLDPWLPEEALEYLLFKEARNEV